MRRAEGRADERKERRRRMRVAVLLGLLAVAVGIGVRAFTLTGETEPEPDPSSSARARELNTALVVITHEDDTGLSLQDVVLMASDPLEPSFAQIVSIPPDMLSTLPTGKIGLRTAFRESGAASVKLAVENATGLHVGEVGALSDVELVAILGAAGSITIQVPWDVYEGEEVVYLAGAHEMSAAEAVAYSAILFDSPDPARTAAHRVAFWRMAAGRDVNELGEALAKVEDLDPTVAGAWLRQSSASVPVVESLVTRENDEGQMVDLVASRALISRLQGAWLSGTEPAQRSRIGISGPVADIGEVFVIAVSSGFEVVETSEAPSRDALTFETENTALLDRLIEVLGVGQLLEPDEPLAGLDIWIRLGPTRDQGVNAG